MAKRLMKKQRCGHYVLTKVDHKGHILETPDCQVCWAIRKLPADQQYAHAHSGGLSLPSHEKIAFKKLTEPPHVHDGMPDQCTKCN